MRRWYLVETLMVQLLLTVFGCMKRYFSTFIVRWFLCSSEDLLTVSLRTANVVLFKSLKSCILHPTREVTLIIRTDVSMPTKIILHCIF